MNIHPDIEGILLVIIGIIMLNKKINEIIIRTENRISGVKSSITPQTLKFHQLIGGIIIFIGIILIFN